MREPASSYLSMELTADPHKGGLSLKKGKPLCEKFVKQVPEACSGAQIMKRLPCAKGAVDGGIVIRSFSGIIKPMV